MAFEYIKNRFGSKKGLLRYLNGELRHLFGFYNEFRQVDFKRVSRLVFVCQGNICRSSLGEAVARAHNFNAISFGLDTCGGDNADPRAILWATNNGFDLSTHITSRVSDYRPLPGDLLVGMEPSHVNILKTQFMNQPVQITLIGLWLNPACIYIHDPYNTNKQYFDACETKVAKATANIVSKIKARETSNAIA